MTLFEFFHFLQFSRKFLNSTPSKIFTRVIIRKILKFSKSIRMKSGCLCEKNCDYDAFAYNSMCRSARAISLMAHEYRIVMHARENKTLSKV
jgi:hypothetical protein